MWTRQPVGSPCDFPRRMLMVFPARYHVSVLVSGTRQRLVVLSAYRFPHGDATATRILQLARAAGGADAPTLVVNDWPPGEPMPPRPPTPPDGVELVTVHANGRNRLARLVSRLTRPARLLRAMRRHGVYRHQVSAVCVPLGLVNLTTWVLIRTVLRRRIVVDASE